jgi:glutathione S-transferase
MVPGIIGLSLYHHHSEAQYQHHLSYIEATMTRTPFLLYVYPWMPFPRRVIIYLREKGIASSLVTIVPVSDPQHGDAGPPSYPPRPSGSLPILVIPIPDPQNGTPVTYIRQSIAIMNYLDELCDSAQDGFPKSQYPMRGTDALSRARHAELLALADECTIAWNPVRMFGTGTGTMALPAASKEMLRWIYRPLNTMELWFKDRDFSELRKGGRQGPTMAEIVLYQFLEFTNDCYGKDMTQGSGEKVKDVYGREVVEKYTKLREFYDAFRTRDSAVRDEAAGEVASENVLERMMTWHEDSS